MDINSLNIDDLFSTDLTEDDHVVRSVSDQPNTGDIAIIGLACQVGSAKNLNEFWGTLSEGQSEIRPIPENRKQDIKEYLRLNGTLDKYTDEDYFNEAFIDDIDTFDYVFFGLSKMEADLMDPHQRLFLETAWLAIEEAGCGGESIVGSNTGVFAGLSNDFGEDYRRLTDTFSPDAPEISIVGNIKSVIASRLAYLFDLRGPSMVVDTACSSSLVALHLACKSLRSGECDTALVGSVNLNLVPVLLNEKTGVGVKDIHDNLAHDNHTKAFDQKSDGMSIGEGVFALLLKPLCDAQTNGDHIHAIVKGSAINQDGKSMGLTAPNSYAQARLIQNAWEDAGVSPLDVSYIEAHGTGTRLGDPIEISGIDKAFSSMTKRKQFCAVGSVKTNIGHLDNASGLAGLFKVVLSMKHRKIPASLNFRQPNSQISFVSSSVYVNDRISDWSHDAFSPVTAGVSSFGLSGTNCHVVLKSYSQSDEKSLNLLNNINLLPISATSRSALHQLTENYIQYFEEEPNANISNVCYTASVGRRHYEHRLVLVFTSREEMLKQLKDFLNGKEGNYTYMRFRIVSDDTSIEKKDGKAFAGEISEAQQAGLSKRANDLLIKYMDEDGTVSDHLKDIVDSYCAGASLDWSRLYSKRSYSKESIPTYPFEKSRCWLKASLAGERLAIRKNIGNLHPLVDDNITSPHTSIYSISMNINRHWALSDHKVNGVYVLPGTCYVELILTALKSSELETNKVLSLASIQFISPFVVEGTDTRKLVVEHKRDTNQISICSSGESGNWLDHVKAQYHEQNTPPEINQVADYTAIIKRLKNEIAFTQDDDLARGLVIGDRWYKSINKGWANESNDEFLIKITMPAKYKNEINEYFYHPALLDTAINGANHLISEEELYLPLYYQGLHVVSSLPADFYVHLKLMSAVNKEVVKFSVKVFDEFGRVCAIVDEYGVKRVANFNAQDDKELMVYSLIPKADDNTLVSDGSCLDESCRRTILVILEEDGIFEPGLEDLTKIGVDITKLLLNEAAADLILSNLNSSKQEFDGIVYFPSEKDNKRSDISHFTSLLKFIQLMIQHKINTQGNLLVNTWVGDATKERIIQSALTSFICVAAEENPQLSIKPINVSHKDIHQVISLVENERFFPDVNKPITVGYPRKRYLTYGRLPKEGRIELADDGSYLLTGGLGGVGLEFAQFFSAQAQRQNRSITLILTSTSEIPDPSKWPELLQENNIAPKLKRRIETLMRIQSPLVRLDCRQLLCEDENQVSGLLQYIRTRYGRINGILHLAGKAGDGFIINKSVDQLKSVLSPKMQGAWHLHKLTCEDKLDFFVLFSSIATLSSEAGQSDYIAANRFMEALVEERRAKGQPGLAVGWPAWREVGMAAEYQAVHEDEIFKPVNAAQALSAFSKILSEQERYPASIYLAQLNLEKSVADIQDEGLQLDESIKKLFSNASSERKKNVEVDTRNINLTGVDIPDEADLLVANIWAKVLGQTEFDVNDAFNDLGGNSILTTQKYKEFDRLHPGVIDMADLFTNTTLKEQANFFREALGLSQHESSASAGTEEDLLEQQLAQLAAGKITIDEVEVQ